MTEKDVTTLLVRLLANNGNPRPFNGNQLSALLKTYLAVDEVDIHPPRQVSAAVMDGQFPSNP